MQWEKPSQELIELLVTRMESFDGQRKSHVRQHVLFR